MMRVSEPDLGELEYSYLRSAFESTMISGHGRFVLSAEDGIKKLSGSDEALVTCNGTAALHLALMALGIGPGHEVIVPSFAYIAPVNAITYVGATPVFVDSDPMTWTLDPNKIEPLITSSTRAILGVHVYGHTFDFEAIRRIAVDHGLYVIEDAAEAHFASSHGKMAGSLGDISTFSFFGNKILTCGEGGAVTSNSKELAESMRIIRNQGMDPSVRFYHPVIGNNFRLNNLSAAILTAQLQRGAELLEKRQTVYDIYSKLVKTQVPELRLQPAADWALVAPWLFTVVPPKGTTTLIQKSLERQGFETRPLFRPAHTMPSFQNEASIRSDLSVAEEIASEGINLPTSSLMSEKDVNCVVVALKQALWHIKRDG